MRKVYVFSFFINPISPGWLTFWAPKMAIGHGRGPKFSPHVPTTILIWVWEKKVKKIFMGLLWPHLKKLFWIVKNAKFSIFENGKNEKMAITWPFFVEMAPDFVLQLSLPKTDNFCFLTRKIRSQTKWLAAILYFCQKRIFWLWGPLACPKNRIFSRKWSQKLRRTFLGKVKPYNHHLSIKNIEKILFKKVAGGIRPPPGLIGLTELFFKGLINHDHNFVKSKGTIQFNTF